MCIRQDILNGLTKNNFDFKKYVETFSRFFFLHFCTLHNIIKSVKKKLYSFKKLKHNSIIKIQNILKKSQNLI